MYTGFRGVDVKTEVLYSKEIGKSITEYAKEKNMYVIVMGAKGMTIAIKEFFLGYALRTRKPCPLSGVCNPSNFSIK